METILIILLLIFLALQLKTLYVLKKMNKDLSDTIVTSKEMTAGLKPIIDKINNLAPKQ